MWEGRTDVVDVLLLLLADVAEDIVLGIAEYLHGDGVVVVLQRRHVVVAKCQLRLCVHLIPASINLHRLSAVATSLHFA